MPGVTFPSAEKVTVYELSDRPGFWRKINAAVAKTRPDAVRVMYGESLSWFVIQNSTGVTNTSA